MKKNLLFCMVLIVILVSSCSSGAQQQTRGFDTPYACAQAVFEALQKQDIAAIEDCFAIPEMARLFDFRKFCERLNCVTALYSYLPTETDLGVAYNEASIRATLYSQIAFTSVLLVNREYGEMMTSGKTYGPLNDEIYSFISFLETPSAMEGFGLLTLDSIIAPDTFERYGELYSDERNTKNRAIQMSMWPVEDNVELVLIASMPNGPYGDDKFILPLRFVQINGKWLADPTGSNFRSILGVPYRNLCILASEIE